jgi:predicted nucleic acid-binding protein
MIFAALGPGERIFIDANTWVYHFTSHAKFGVACTSLIRRVEHQQVIGFTSTHVLTEVAHRLMLTEASNAQGWPLAGALKRLQSDPTVIHRLVRFRQALDELLKTKVEILTVSPQHVLAAATVSQQTGLLSNDALIVAVMQANGLINLASHEADFDRVPGITRYGPV